MSSRTHLLSLLALLTLALFLGGCRSGAPSPTATRPATPDAVVTAAPPSSSAAAEVEPAQGGTITLETGADVTFPQQAVSGNTRVTFRTEDRPAAAPIPRSLIGAVYTVEMAGGELTGIALLRLPLPAGVSPDSYDLAPYFWNGSGWERITGRVQEGFVQFGMNRPGTYSIQGQWRFADGAVGLVKVDAAPGEQALPLTVVGQYRFSALPVVQGEYVSASLILKQDTSGGAGRASGIESLDSTVAEAPLLFKLDPANPRGLIEFNHTFELRPDLLDLKPGDSTRFYTVFVAEDSAAPTRRVSSGVEYTQIMPLQIIEGEVVRPTLSNEARYSLRWNVTLNGAPFYQEQATTDRLVVQSLIDRGGLGDYRVVLEVEHEGGWVGVSNEVTFQLALRPTHTLEPGQAPSGTVIAANVATPTPSRAADDTIPVPPTRRPTPGAGEAITTPTVAAVSGTATPSATPTIVNGTSAFWADRSALPAGECATLNWQVENVLAVFLNGAPVTGRESRQVCPTVTTTYILRVQTSAGFQDRAITISVTAVGTGVAGDIEFIADVYQVAPGGCATLRWRAVNVRAVFLNNQGVAGEASQQVCPQFTTDYTLRVESTSGQTFTRTLTIVVAQTGSNVVVRFWSEQYSLPDNGCTTLHWKVQNVRQVFLDEEGVAGEGTRQVCPGGSQFYTLRVVDNDGQDLFRELTLLAGDPGLSPNEIIAQGVVANVTNPSDIDPVLPGDQRGYVLNISGLNLLYAGTAGWGQSTVTLRLPEEAANYGENGPVDWPIRAGQQVEFRAACENNVCSINLQVSSYLFLRSE